MEKDVPVNVDNAMTQSRRLCEELQHAECALHYMQPQPGLSDFVFTANYALVIDDVVVLSRFRHKERKSEESIIKQWFYHRRDRFHRIVELPEGLVFEGQGDAFLMNDTIFAGYGDSKDFRTDHESHDTLRAVFGRPVISLHLVHTKFYHLDTCFRQLDNETAIYFPDAFDAKSRYLIEKHVHSPLAVGPRDAFKFICNAIPVGRKIIFGAEPTKQLSQELCHRGFTIVVVELDEFFKAGGSAQCLVLFLS